MRSLGMSLDHDLLAPSTMNRSLASTLTLVVMLASAGAHGAETTIRVSSLGCRPGSRKTATFLKGGRFTVRRADGDAGFSASLDTPVADSVSGQTVYVGDFSSVETPGEYYLELA